MAPRQQIFGQRPQDALQHSRALPLLEPPMASLVWAISRRQIVPRCSRAQDPKHPVHQWPCFAPWPAAMVGPSLLPEFDQRPDQFPLHVREFCHASDLLQTCSTCKCSLGSTIYEIASQFSVLSSQKERRCPSPRTEN